MSISRKLMMGASGSLGEKLYIESLFSTWLYTGNGSTQTITNGIDLAGEGGLVWIKGRASAYAHSLTDTARGTNKQLFSNLTNAEQTDVNQITSFTSTGFTLGDNSTGSGGVNFGTGGYVSWTFRKAPGFFDVVTYTGNATTNNIAHNLGSTPGCIIIKRTNTTGNWAVYHRSRGTTEVALLNTTDAFQAAGSNYVTAVSSTTFTLTSNAGDVNASGSTYVAYLFAHDEQIFGEAGDQSVIKCGSYTGNGSTTGPTVSLGWEPQWLLIKRTDAAGENWFLVDSMRGLTVAGSDDEYLLANASNAAFATSFIAPLATGFQLNSTSGAFNASGGTYIYIAIRRGPMRTPTDATKVFAVSSPATGTYTTTTNFPIDSAIVKSESTVADWYMMSRLTGNTKYLNTTTTAAESTTAGAFNIDSNTSFTQNLVVTNPLNYIFRRAPGFFDVVAYTGTGVARTVNHNLGVAPELIIIKNRTGGLNDWQVGASSMGWTKMTRLNTNYGEITSSTYWNDTAPTSSVFTVGTNGNVNTNNSNYIAYLFATCSGVSKVGNYTGSGTTKQIDCGFTNGARFVLIKRLDTTNFDSDWYIWDTARGIVSGNDPYLLLNSTAAEVTNTDYIDPLSSGFQISSTAPAAINANGGSFIFLAIA